MIKKFHGSALISALFIMTLVAIAATAMSTRLQLDIYRTRTLIESDKIYLASQAVTFWAMDTLSRKKIHYSRNKEVGKLMDFPKQLQQSYPEILVKGSLYDLQALFNINNLQDIKYHPMFYKLLENLPNKSPNGDQKKIFQSINDWIMPYKADRGRNDFLNHYLAYPNTYLPGFQPFKTLSELHLIREINVKTYQSLIPYLTVIPEVTPINLLSAPRRILKSLGNGLNDSAVHELIEASQSNELNKLEKVQEIMQKLDINASLVTIDSQYFLSIAEASTGELSLQSYVILKRTRDKNGKLMVQLVSESLNTK